MNSPSKCHFIRVRMVIWTMMAALLLHGCAGLNPRLEEPTVTITSLELLDSQGLAQRFRVGLLVTNPNSVPLPINGMSYTLGLNGYDLINGATGDVPTLKAYGDTQVTIDATADIFAALGLLKSFASKPEQKLNYQFNAKLDVQGWRPNVTIKKDGVIALE